MVVNAYQNEETQEKKGSTCYKYFFYLLLYNSLDMKSHLYTSLNSDDLT